MKCCAFKVWDISIHPFISCWMDVIAYSSSGSLSLKHMHAYTYTHSNTHSNKNSTTGLKRVDKLNGNRCDRPRWSVVRSAPLFTRMSKTYSPVTWHEQKPQCPGATCTVGYFMLKDGVCYGQTVSSTEAQPQNSSDWGGQSNTLHVILPLCAHVCVWKFHTRAMESPTEAPSRRSFSKKAR